MSDLRPSREPLPPAPYLKTRPEQELKDEPKRKGVKMQFNKDFLNQLERIERNTENLQYRVGKIEVHIERVDRQLKPICTAFGVLIFVMVLWTVFLIYN